MSKQKRLNPSYPLGKAILFSPANIAYRVEDGHRIKVEMIGRVNTSKVIITITKGTGVTPIRRTEFIDVDALKEAQIYLRNATIDVESGWQSGV